MNRNGMTYEAFTKEAEEYGHQIIEEAKAESGKDYVAMIMERDGLTREEAEEINNMLNKSVKKLFFNPRVNKKEV